MSVTAISYSLNEIICKRLPSSHSTPTNPSRNQFFPKLTAIINFIMQNIIIKF